MKDAMVVRSGSSLVGLRHDLDTVYGLRWGLPKIIFIKKKYDVKSTFFVRVDVIRSDKDKRALKRIADEGWEIGLHLSQNGIATVLVHPEGFVRSVQSHGLMKIPLTLLRKGMMNKIYDRFLGEFKDKVKLKKYVEIC